jgi:hypothetical protein
MCCEGRAKAPSPLPWVITSCTGWARARANFKTPSPPQTSTRDISTTMAPIDEALADSESREEEEHFTMQAIADHHSVNRSNLSRR